MAVVEDRVALVNSAQGPTVMVLADPEANDALARLIDEYADRLPAAYDGSDQRQQRMVGAGWRHRPWRNNRRRNDGGGWWPPRW